jgi:hypothetical protein
MIRLTLLTWPLAGLLLLGLVGPTGAQSPPPQGKTLAASAGVFAYPAKGQASDLQAKDEAECYNWARDQSGYDPMAPPPTPAPTQASQPAQPAAGGTVAKGAVRGAAAGAVIGEVVDDDAGGGAAVGATVGVLRAGKKNRQAKAQQQQQAKAQQQASEEQAKAAQQELAATFKRAMTACLEARGYTVK